PRLMSDRNRKRVYRVGLNVFNKKPNKGIDYMVDNRFVDPRPSAVARFLISRKGLSRKMIGHYLGSMQDAFNMEVLKCFAEEFDLTGLQIDVALRVFQSQFQISGEAQKIEKFMEVFSSRYRECNPHLVGKVIRSSDTIFLLSFAIIMLNTDLHNKNIKQERKMTLVDFLKNLKGLDAGGDINSDYLTGIYERVKEQEFIPSPDHTNQVIILDRMITGKTSVRLFVFCFFLSFNHRRFVCHCRMHEILDLNKTEKIGSHARGLFLFNDLLIVTKLSSRKKKNCVHRLKQTIPLQGVSVYLLETPHYKYGIRLKNATQDDVIIVTLCARDQEEQRKFVEDLKESILEVVMMMS
ncbi:hypothetical protein HELRODRAFT_68418, partial [Helobdella robusta]|uniref:SEC7 domain-containing protein n=1 Tax=Helobdella robusta TaxID=6412 RepID=T1FZE3_HELRO